MAASISYFPGGVDDAAPAKNIAEYWDGDTDQYTRYDAAGNIVEQRPLTDAEKASFNGSV